MAGFDDAGVHRADGHLENPLAFHLSEFVPDTLERRQHRPQVEILAQRINLGPVVVQRAAPRIRMTQQFQAEQVLHFPLLPVHRVDGIRERGELRFVGRHWHAQREEPMRRIQGENVIKMKRALRLPDVVGKQADEAGVPFPVELRAETRDHLRRRIEVDLVGSWSLDRSRNRPAKLSCRSARAGRSSGRMFMTHLR